MKNPSPRTGEDTSSKVSGDKLSPSTGVKAVEEIPNML